MIKIYDGRNEFYQWDLDRKLIVDDTTVTELHFCNKTSDCSLVVEVRDGVADVPNILLQTDWTINVYAYCGDCYTKEHTTFKVNRRSKPDDYIYTETEVKRWEALEKRVNETLDTVASAEEARNVAEAGRVAAEDARNVAEQARENDFSALTAEAQILINTLDSHAYTVDNHEKRITQLERHISNDYFVTDDSTAYEKIVDVSVCPFAQLNSIGGMTYKSRNHIPFPYYGGKGVGHTESMNGVTMTVNSDRSITLNGTSTATVAFILQTNSKYGDTTINAMSSEYATNGTYALSKRLYYNSANGILSVNIAGGTTIQETIFPMLNEGKVLFPYEPYYEGLRDTKVTEIKSYGRNLANINNIVGGEYYRIDNDTISITTPASSAGIGCGLTLQQLCPNLKVDDVCILTANTTSKSKYIYLSGSYASSWYFGATKTITQEMLESKVVFYADNGDSSAVISKFMITYGDVALPYSPYRAEPISYPIPAEMQVSKGVKGYADTIDFESGKIIHKVGEVDMGTLSYNHYTSGSRQMFETDLSSLDLQVMKSMFEPINALADGYRATSYNDSWVDKDMAYTNRAATAGVKEILFIDNRYTNANDFKSAVKGKKLIFALETPIVTDISAELANFDNIIEIEGGGKLEFVNEYKNAVPSSITYLMKEGSI